MHVPRIMPCIMQSAALSPCACPATQYVSPYLQEVLFDQESYKLQSKHFNLIAFQCDVALLVRVLRGAGANDADVLEVKLTQRSVAVPGEAQEVSKPFLLFTGKVGMSALCVLQAGGLGIVEWWCLARSWMLPSVSSMCVPGMACLIWDFLRWALGEQVLNLAPLCVFEVDSIRSHHVFMTRVGRGSATST